MVLLEINVSLGYLKDHHHSKGLNFRHLNTSLIHEAVLFCVMFRSWDMTGSKVRFFICQKCKNALILTKVVKLTDLIYSIEKSMGS